METIAKIRLLYHVKKKSISEIARQFRLSRNTIYKYLHYEGDVPKYARRSSAKPQLGPHEAILQQWVETESHLPRKQRRTARRLFEDLRKEGYTGAYDSVQRWVKRWRAAEHPGVQKAYIPLVFRPGEAYQFDWSTETVILGGVTCRVKVAHFRLTHSRMSFVRAYPRETQEMVFAAHQEAFAAFGGVPERGIYDNPKTIVHVVYDQVVEGQDRDFNPRFLAMMNHYLIDPTACTVAAGWEKGQVESQVDTLRKWFFTPTPRFGDIDQLNAWLWQQCLERAHSEAHPEQKERSIWEVFQEEQPALRPFRATFDGYVGVRARVSKTCLVTVDRNQYSVPAQYAGQYLHVRRYVDRILVLHEGRVVASHRRHMGRGQVLTDVTHYLDVLERKPGALRNGRPFQELPRAITTVRQRLHNKPLGDREFVTVLLMAREYGLDNLETACAMALEQGAVNAAVVLNLMHRLANPLPPAPVCTPEALRLREEPRADCARYDLLRGNRHVH